MCGLGFVTYFDSDAYVMTGRPYRRLLVQIESHSNEGSEPRLQPTPQLTATPDR